MLLLRYRTFQNLPSLYFFVKKRLDILSVATLCLVYRVCINKALLRKPGLWSAEFFFFILTKIGKKEFLWKNTLHTYSKKNIWPISSHGKYIENIKKSKIWRIFSSSVLLFYPMSSCRQFRSFCTCTVVYISEALGNALMDKLQPYTV